MNGSKRAHNKKDETIGIAALSVPDTQTISATDTARDTTKAVGSSLSIGTATGNRKNAEMTPMKVITMTASEPSRLFVLPRHT